MPVPDDGYEQLRHGKRVMVAFNITDEHDAMLRHAELVAREGGSCVMASLNWCGFSSIQALRRRTEEAIVRGVFGVPTVLLGQELFWGTDSLDHLEDYLLGKDPVPPDLLLKWQDLRPSAVRSPR